MCCCSYCDGDDQVHNHGGKSQEARDCVVSLSNRYLDRRTLFHWIFFRRNLFCWTLFRRIICHWILLHWTFFRRVIFHRILFRWTLFRWFIFRRDTSSF